MGYSQQRSKFTGQVTRLINPIAGLLYRFNVTPNNLTMCGVVLSAVAAGLIIYHQLYWAGIFFAVGSILDVFDGAVARLVGKDTRFGAFLDSTMDRVAEGLIFAAIAHYYSSEEQTLLMGITVIVLVNSFLISYTRARAEGLQIDCKVGLLTRLERVILICVGLILDILAPIIVILFLLTMITVLQRIIHVAFAAKDE